MRRREFVMLIGSATIAWPLVVRGQQSQPRAIRRIGILMNRAADDVEGQAGIAAFKVALEQLQQADARTVQFEVRWGADNVEQERKYAAELVALSPDIILASGRSA
jgi:putative tryptophan/tyrosine transport system substrate-binding protein